MQYINIEEVRTARKVQHEELTGAVERYCGFLREQLAQIPERRLRIVRDACEADLENDPESLRGMANALQQTEEDRLDAQHRLSEAECFLEMLAHEIFPDEAGAA